MGIMAQVKAKARLDIKRIVLPEGDEPRTVQAAAQIRAEGIACPILLGAPERIHAVAAETKADLGGISCISASSDKTLQSIYDQSLQPMIDNIRVSHGPSGLLMIIK